MLYFAVYVDFATFNVLLSAQFRAIDVVDPDRGQVVIATKDIAQGEELIMNYGPEYWGPDDICLRASAV